MATAKTIYVRVRDSQPANGWGGRITRSQLRFQRAGAPVESSTLGYDAAGRTTTTTLTDPAATPPQLVTTVTRDPRGLPTAVTDPAGATTTYGYDGPSGGTDRRAATVDLPGRDTHRQRIADEDGGPQHLR